MPESRDESMEDVFRSAQERAALKTRLMGKPREQKSRDVRNTVILLGFVFLLFVLTSVWRWLR